MLWRGGRESANVEDRSGMRLGRAFPVHGTPAFRIRAGTEPKSSPDRERSPERYLPTDPKLKKLSGPEALSRRETVKVASAERC